MLLNLYIKNFTLIDEINIEFDPGLNIFLGETGAGKSIIIDALMTTLGERASPDLVKSGEAKSIVEATFSIENPEIINSIINDPENIVQDTFILRREITSKGTSRCFLNDTPYPLNTIKEIGDYLVDFHGQHSHQQLLSTKHQLELLDSLSKNNVLIEEYKKLKKELEEAIEKLNNFEQELISINKEREKIDYDLQEIIRINPQPNELEIIENELKKLENLELINISLLEVYELLYKSDTSALDTISLAAKKINNLVKYDTTFERIVQQLEGILETIDDCAKEIQKRFIDVELDPGYVENLRIRLSELKYLEKKYLTYENIFKEKERLQNIILSTYSIEEKIKKVRNEILAFKEKIKSIAEKIHKNRKIGINLLETKVPEILDNLGMKNVTFSVSILQDEIENNNLKDLSIEWEGKYLKLLNNGLDRIEFLIATNPNTKPLPLNNIASGGELSRLMLALKSLAAEHYNFPTMIFDEIDVGISGKIASMTAQLMKNLSQKHQIIAITHLPQIAAAGDNTILIEKKEINGNVKISAQKLNEDQHILEIARLLSGEIISEFAVENAKKLIYEFNSRK
ncbi:MAG: DNA repair protein RecN [Ignavibacteria bacterium]|nr:DNA repair protein RecN [Ignavibacteria bacterium]